MPDEPAEKPQGIPIKDAIRLKYQISQGITFGNTNMNAVEIEEFRKLTAEDYVRIRQEYCKWYHTPRSQFFLSALTLTFVAGAIILYHYNWGLLAVVSGSLAIVTYSKLCSRGGHAEGFVDGYDSGYEAGMNKALNLTDKDLAEIHEFGTDMKIDKSLLERLDNRDGSAG